MYGYTTIDVCCTMPAIDTAPVYMGFTESDVDVSSLWIIL